MNITGATRIYGLLGWPLGHSISPGMQNTAFEAAGIDGIYIPMPVRPENLAEAIAGIRSLSIKGVNVTLPHKTAVMEYLDEIDSNARDIGAVNTIVNNNGHLVGFNTDGEGFLHSLSRQSPPNTAVIFGAGGAALAIGHALFQYGVTKLNLVVRNPVRAKKNVNLLAQRGNVALCDWKIDCCNPEVFSSADILINATPLGMYPNSEGCPPVPWNLIAQCTQVVDLVYNPPLTKFLQEARRHGLSTISGTGMLVEQGALSFEIWTGSPAPRQEMSDYVNQKLTEIN